MTSAARGASPPGGGPGTGAGYFITFEGIDGCGKTVQARRLAAQLRNQGVPVVETREPGGTAIGKGLRALLLDSASAAMTPHCEVLLYLADRVQHLAEVIRPALARGDTVICDRYHDATLAYQHHGRGLDLAPLEAFIAREIAPLPPHLTLWLDVDVATARRRIAARASGGAAGNEVRMDQYPPEFHERVRRGYGELAGRNPERIVRIDGAPDLDQVEAEIWRQVSRRAESLAARGGGG